MKLVLSSSKKLAYLPLTIYFDLLSSKDSKRDEYFLGGIFSLKNKLMISYGSSSRKITQNINTNLKSKLEPVLENKSRIRKNKYGQEELNFENTSYELPKLNLLSSPNGKETKIEESQKDLKNNAQKLEDVLSEFGIMFCFFIMFFA